MRPKPYARLVLLAVVVGLLWLDAGLLLSAARTEQRQRATAASLERIKQELAVVESEAIALRQAATERQRALSAQHDSPSPNHERIMRMLRLLGADRSKFGPSNPLHIKFGYQSAALGIHSELMDNADYVRANQKIRKYALESEYAPFVAHLSNGKVDGAHLIDLTFDWQSAPLEARAIATSNGLSRQEVQAASEAAAASVQKEIEAYLGPEEFATYQSYTKGQYLVGQVQQRLSYSGTGLTTEQFVSLATLIGTTNDERGLLEQTVPEDLPSAAAAFLSPDQIRALQAFTAGHAK